MGKHEHDLVIIGAGPGGYVAAIRAAQLGLNVACVEREERLGGTCLRIGCIPSKALLESSERFEEARHSFARHGVMLEGVKLDLAAMLKRKDAIVDKSTQGVEKWMRSTQGVTVIRGHARFTGPHALAVGDELSLGGQIVGSVSEGAVSQIKIF